MISVATPNSTVDTRVMVTMSSCANKRFEYKSLDEMRAEVQGEIGAYIEIVKRAYMDCRGTNDLYSETDRENLVAIYHLLWLVQPHQLIAAKHVATHIAEDELLEIMDMA